MRGWAVHVKSLALRSPTEVAPGGASLLRPTGPVKPLYADASWLALDKPAAMLTTPDGRRPSLVDEARRLRPRATHHHPLSRLDVDVTGVVLFALTADAIALAARARSEAAWHRQYLGLTAPPPQDDEGCWTWPIAVDRRAPTRRTTGDGDERREAETRYRVVARAGGLAAVAFAPVTGRTHQIRVHAATARAPLAGDGAYGGARRLVCNDGAVLAAARVMLHAWRLWLPLTETVIEAPWPADMEALWAGCGGGEFLAEARRFR